jgi:hypothetical protein
MGGMSKRRKCLQYPSSWTGAWQPIHHPRIGDRGTLRAVLLEATAGNRDAKDYDLIPAGTATEGPIPEQDIHPLGLGVSTKIRHGDNPRSRAMDSSSCSLGNRAMHTLQPKSRLLVRSPSLPAQKESSRRKNLFSRREETVEVLPVSSNGRRPTVLKPTTLSLRTLETTANHHSIRSFLRHQSLLRDLLTLSARHLLRGTARCRTMHPMKLEGVASVVHQHRLRLGPLGLDLPLR